MPAASLRAARAAACAALLDPTPFAISLPVRGAVAELARIVLRTEGGRLLSRSEVPAGDAVVVAPDGLAWTLHACAEVDRAMLLSPTLAGAEGLARLKAVVRALRVQGIKADDEHALVVHLDVAPLDASAMERFLRLAGRYAPLLALGLGLSAAAPLPSTSPHTLRRFEKTRERIARAAQPRRLAPQEASTVAPPTVDLALDRLLTDAVVSVSVGPTGLHSAEVLGLVQLAVGLLHRAQVSRTVAGTPRPFSADTARYDLRVLLLQLGFIGPEFQGQREQLLRRVTGSAAWRGRPTVASTTSPAA